LNAVRLRKPARWAWRGEGPPPLGRLPPATGAGRGTTGLGLLPPRPAPASGRGRAPREPHTTPQVRPGPSCRPRRRGAPDTLSRRPVGVRPGSSAPGHNRPARHCLAPRGGHGPAHSHFRGEFRPGPRPSLASVHTASLAPHGPLGYGSSERAHQPCSARTQDPAVATSAADAASRVRGSPLSKVSTADDERGLAQPTKKRGSCREARGPGPRTRRSPCGGGAPPTYRGGSAHV